MNLIINMRKREIGNLKSQKFISNYFRNNLKKIDISKRRNISVSDFSLTWLSLETTEYRQ